MRKFTNILLIFALIFVSSFNIFAEDFKLCDAVDFSIEYPSNWEVVEENGDFGFISDEMDAFTITRADFNSGYDIATIRSRLKTMAVQDLEDVGAKNIEIVAEKDDNNYYALSFDLHTQLYKIIVYVQKNNQKGWMLTGVTNSLAAAKVFSKMRESFQIKN